MYGLPLNYNPHGPHSQPLPPNAIPLAQFKAAQSVQDATHLSVDGLRVFCEYDSEVRVHYWDAEMNTFGSSFPCPQGLPADAVRLE